MSELLPCPFCGAQPHKNLGKVWHDSLHGDRHQDTIIKCPHLCAQMTGSADAVIQRWNTRAGIAERERAKMAAGDLFETKD